jgi:uncharacterized membrane protein YkgB
MSTLDSRTIPLTDGLTVDDIDGWITASMNKYGPPLLRYALGIVFVWFGALKIVGVSPAGGLVSATVYFVPPEIFVPLLGVWEVVIGLCLFVRRFIRAGILLLAFQMPGTFLPVLLLPAVVFTTFPYGLTVEGQYIIKNLVIIGAALVVGGHERARMRGER